MFGLWFMFKTKLFPDHSSSFFYQTNTWTWVGFLSINSCSRSLVKKERNYNLLSIGSSGDMRSWTNNRLTDNFSWAVVFILRNSGTGDEAFILINCYKNRKQLLNRRFLVQLFIVNQNPAQHCCLVFETVNWISSPLCSWIRCAPFHFLYISQRKSAEPQELEWEMKRKISHSVFQ